MRKTFITVVVIVLILSFIGTSAVVLFETIGTKEAPIQATETGAAVSGSGVTR